MPEMGWTKEVRVCLGKRSETATRVSEFVPLAEAAGHWAGSKHPDADHSVCARLIPSDVKLTVEQTYAGLGPHR